MSYTSTVSLGLGSSKSGLTLAAKLLTSAGTDFGIEITTGFSEIGNGYYLWTYSNFPNGFVGGVKFYEISVPGTILTIVSITPQNEENPDIKTSVVKTEIDNKTIMSVTDLKNMLDR